MSDQPVSRLRRRLVVFSLIGAIGLAGCTHTITRRVARYEAGAADAGAPTAMTPVPMAAVWKVKVRERGETDYRGIDGTERYLQRGDVVGFRTGADGVIYAVVNRDEIPLALTEKHRRVVWQSKRVATTPFGEGLAATADVAAKVLLVTAGGAALLWIITHPATDDDCDSPGAI